MPRDILLVNNLCPGDVVIETGVVRDLHKAYPGQFRIGVEDRCPQLWKNNPHICRDINRSNGEKIDLGWSVEQTNHSPQHLLEIWADDLARKLNIPKFPIAQYRGDIHLAGDELKRPDRLVGDGPYWVVMAGSKGDCQTKQWPVPYYQEVVDTFGGGESIRFVQCGAMGANNRQCRLNGVTNIVGQTTIRDFLRVIQHAEGVLCSITFAMHAAAAIPTRDGAPKLRPCVVVAGGREPLHVYAYPGHQVCHRAGMLRCNEFGSCWKSDVSMSARAYDSASPWCHSPTVRDGRCYAKCQDLIQPAEVCRAIFSYYESGALSL